MSKLRTRRPQRPQLKPEALEARQLMAADVQFGENIITVHGDESDNQVEVSFVDKETHVVIDAGTAQAQHHKFPTDQVDRLVFYGKAGNDAVFADVDFPLSLFGDDGDDNLNGGKNGDRIIGGSGNDTINGNGGDDYINGVYDDDVINGGDGDDRIYGSSGDDEHHRRLGARCDFRR